MHTSYAVLGCGFAGHITLRSLLVKVAKILRFGHTSTFAEHYCIVLNLQSFREFAARQNFLLKLKTAKI